MFPKLTVEENLRARRLPGAVGQQSTPARMAEIFRIVPAARRAPRMQLAGTMSGGEQAMVSIGRGLMRAPKLAADRRAVARACRRVLVKENFNIIRSINERGITVLLVEQNVHQTLAISPLWLRASKGRVAASGTPTELAARQDVRDAYFG